MADDVLSQYLRNKFSSILQEAESDPHRPSIISRFRSILNIMSKSTTPSPVDTLYKLIDALSECRILAHHRHEAAASKKGFFRAVIVGPLSQYRFRKNLKGQLDEIEKSLKTLAQSDHNGGLSLPPPKLVIQQTYPVLDASRVIGFEREAQQIEDWLINNLYTEGLTAIGIRGRCGGGKTALAQKVFSSSRIQQEFSPRIWVCLSSMLFEQKDTDPRVRVLNYILEETGYDVSQLEYSDFSLNELLEKLRGALVGKRYLIVLDDAWRLDEWYTDLGHSVLGGSEFFTDSLPKGSGGGVIVTSRRENVIRRMVGDTCVIWLQPDSGNDISWKIFKDAVMQQGKINPNHPKLMEIEKDVLNKCDGLPLAARTLASIISECQSCAEVTPTSSLNRPLKKRLEILSPPRAENKKTVIPEYYFLWIQARDLYIVWGNDTRYWTWVSDDRGEEVAELVDVSWLDINTTVNLKKLLIKASYSAYLVFKLREGHYGLHTAKVHVKYVSGEKEGQIQSCSVFVDRKKKAGEQGRFPQTRDREWMEIKLGELFNDLGDGEVNVGFCSTYEGHRKSGLIVKGIELRPSYY